MLIHLTPQIYANRATEPCALIDLKCPELGLDLKGGQELTARRPYPNKDYLVVCRNIGTKAINGFYVETNKPVRDFTVTTRWAVAANHIATHQVRYLVLDDEFDTITQKMVLWYATPEYPSRFPLNLDYKTPARSEPKMEIGSRLDRAGDITDETNELGLLIKRSEVFRLPSIQRERVMSAMSGNDQRMPSLGDAF
ncbi:MAG: DUF6012 family protein [Halopseudomonas sabulinigri]